MSPLGSEIPAQTVGSSTGQATRPLQQIKIETGDGGGGRAQTAGGSTYRRESHATAVYRDPDLKKTLKMLSSSKKKRNKNNASLT